MLKKRATTEELENINDARQSIGVKRENGGFKRVKIENEEPRLDLKVVPKDGDSIELKEYNSDKNMKLYSYDRSSHVYGNITQDTNRHIRHTPEQKAIIDHAIQLTNDKNYGNVIRVISGAGTGKTTTLELLSAELLKRNQKILYLVYNKEAQLEAISRFSNHPNLDCYTTHAASMKFLINSENTRKIPTDERLLQDKIKRFYKDDIMHYLTTNSATFQKSEKKASGISLVGFWIFKTLQTWIRASKIRLEKHYYPIDIKHVNIFNFSPGNFYIKKAMDAWIRIWRGELPISFDCFLKYAQIGNCVIPNYDYIMLDESQDTTECVIDLFVTQQIKGRQKKNIYLVGDAVQCIYSFRGSKAQLITQYPEPVINFKLTECFRFGINIDRVANLFLFIKENSPQAHLFNSYRLKGVSKSKGIVLRDQLDYPKTIIARGNSSLILKSLELLIEKPDIKIEILGGTDKMDKTINLTVKFYEFYMGIKKDAIFKDYEDFNAFLISVRDEEKNEFSSVLVLISKFGKSTLTKLEIFKNKINKKNKDEAYDVSMTTSHQAKGKEFDRVEVLDDFIALKTSPKIKKDGYSLASTVTESEMEFCLPVWGDELNLWYVAVTRARLEMRLPHKYWLLYDLMIETMNVGVVDGSYRLYEKYFKEFHEELVTIGSCVNDTSKLELLKDLIEEKKNEDKPNLNQLKRKDAKSFDSKIEKEKSGQKRQTTILNFFGKRPT